ncbi:hypothetical protein SDC9_158565 [bioreactor metagenome]|uniref:Uncharacterized protein n=1 Tax=bioreactor metagenome TaxID=1076179 RepID=A0A645FFJ1_9ZZZZ|nr:hypothetical protein [Oscillospiraceae bacterium]
MKKQYRKPTINIENFKLTESIAVTCQSMTVFALNNTCYPPRSIGSDENGEAITVFYAEGCSISGDNDPTCYHAPSGNVIGS